MSAALALRAVACRGWRWMPGMLTQQHGARLLFEDRSLGWQAWSMDRRRHTLMASDALPDLFDPATVGCLLALVREAHSDPRGSCIPMEWANTRESGWGYVTGWGAGVGPFAPTEAAALVAALEAAP